MAPSRASCKTCIACFLLLVINHVGALLSLTCYRTPASMVTSTRTDREQFPVGEFASCWPVGLGRYNGGSAVFLAKERRLLDPREEVLPIPISERAVPLLSEASKYCV